MARTKDQSLAGRNRRIVLLRRNGFTFSAIADMEGVSRVRVGQIVAEANAELPEDETRAEIASLLEFAERKLVELINDPGYMLGPNGKLAVNEDGEPVPNKQLINESVRTLAVIAEKRSKLYAADKQPPERKTPHDQAMQEMWASLAAHKTQMEVSAAERRELEEWRSGTRRAVIQGTAEVVRELPPGGE